MEELIIPHEIQQDINSYSGYISLDSKFGKKNLKGLFYTTENKRYLVDQLYALLTCEEYVRDNLLDNAIYDFNEKPHNFNNVSTYYDRCKLMVQEFKKQKLFLSKIITNMIEAYQLPFREDIDVLNPVMQLNNVNLDFLVKFSKDIIQNPQNLIPVINQVNDVGKIDIAEYQYTAESYNDGTWHPEHLFTNSYRNKKNPYWIPFEVDYSSAPNAKGPGHKFNSIIYNQGRKDYFESDIAKDGSKKTPAKNPTSFGQFPDWQSTPTTRLYDRDYVIEGLEEQGTADRRTQTPYAYDMRPLLRRPQSQSNSPTFRRKTIYPTDNLYF